MLLTLEMLEEYVDEMVGELSSPPDPEGFRAMVLALAAHAVGTDAEALTKFTNYDPVWVRECVARLHKYQLFDAHDLTLEVLSNANALQRLVMISAVATGLATYKRQPEPSWGLTEDGKRWVEEWRANHGQEFRHQLDTPHFQSLVGLRRGKPRLR